MPTSQMRSKISMKPATAAPSETSGQRSSAPPGVPFLPVPPPPGLPNVGVESRPTALLPVSGMRCARRRRAAAPRQVPGVQDGAEEHLQDLSELVKEEWESVEPDIITHCWVKARLQRVEMETHLNAQNGELPPLLARRVQRRCEDDCPTCVGLHVWGRLCRRGWARPSGVGVAVGGGRGRPAWA